MRAHFISHTALPKGGHFFTIAKPVIVYYNNVCYGSNYSIQQTRMGTIMKKKTKFGIFLTLTLLWVCFIFTRSLQPGDQSAEESGWVLTMIQLISPNISMHIVRKLAHFTEFAILGALASLTQLQATSVHLTLLLFFGLLCAMADETIQLSISGRNGQVQDVWIDFAGVAAAVILIFVLHQMTSRTGNST